MGKKKIERQNSHHLDAEVLSVTSLRCTVWQGLCKVSAHFLAKFEQHNMLKNLGSQAGFVEYVVFVTTVVCRQGSAMSEQQL